MLETTQSSPSVFISYASPDRERVLPFFEWLQKREFNVWMDCRNIKAGQNWEHEIYRALEKSTFVLCFISKHSVSRRGYLQRELQIAFDKRNEKLIDDIYLIPIIMEDNVSIPEQLKDLQSIKATDSNCLEQIADALKYQLERLGIERREVQEKEQVYWTTEIKREEWDGIPGYEVELEFISVSSEIYADVHEIGEYIKGDLLTVLFEHRAEKASPSPTRFNYGQDKFIRTNTYDSHCSQPIIQGKVISIQYAIHWYGAGAAHPNHNFKTYAFLVDPVFRIDSLQVIFTDPDAALKQIQEHAKEELGKIRFDDSDDEDSGLNAEWIAEGTQKWEDFQAFSFQEDGIEVLFSPYQVGPYVYGSHAIKIPYRLVKSWMEPVFISALGIEYLTL